MELARFGGTKHEGVDRPALSEAEIEARAQLVDWGRKIGLAPSSDGIANLFLKLAGENPDLPPVLVGSHIDSVPTGGKFDGAFGVIEALECAEAIVASGQRPRRNIEVVSWTNEEGTRFSPSVMGSSAFARARRLEDMSATRDESGVSLAAALERVLSAEPALLRRPIGFPAAAYLEAHIEQGPILEQAGKTIGVITGIYGKLTFQVDVTGEANHAATTPKSARRDALAAATGLVQALQSIWNTDEFVRFTIGTFNVFPNQAFVIPGRVAFHIDIRHPDTQALARIGEMVRKMSRDAPGLCQVSVQELINEPAFAFDEAIRERVASAAQRLRIPSMVMGSAAWHDSVFLNRVCPTGMVFIPCKNGISHNEGESASADDIAAGAGVLAETVFATANSG